MTGHGSPFEQFDISSVNSALSNATSATTPIQDWYEAHYLSVCSGMWNTHAVSAGKNQSTIICAPQRAGYTFSLAQILASDAAQPLLVDSSYGTLDTKAPLILLAIGIAFTGLSLLLVLYGVVAMLVTGTAETPLGALRVAYLAIVAAANVLTISSAKITALAEKMVGTTDIGEGGWVQAWMERGFYVFAWLGTALMWGAMGLGIVVSFRIARALQIHAS
jgi:hypothetical protein